jgi:PKD repeat protein
MFSVFMVARFRFQGAILGVLAGLGLVAAGCEKVPLLAPTGSVITLTTATATLSSNGTAEIVAQVIEPAGTPPHSGTHVTFLTSLGTMEPAEVQTDVNGRAVSTFRANGSSGIATITATSGGSSVAAASALKIAVGSAAVGGIVASANPSLVSQTGGSSTITAKVTDTGGNILAGVPVTFTTDQGSMNPTVANTDATGTAISTLTTTRTAKVTANAGIATSTTTPGTGGTGGTTTTTTPASSTVTVTVNTTASISLGTPVPATPTAGSSVSIPITYGSTANGASPITRITVDWGDGVVSNFTGAPSSISHVYNSPGGYLVVVTGVDALGDTASSTTSVNVGSRPRPTVSITGTVTTQPPNALVTFAITATPTTNSFITSITVDFGDGHSTTLAGNATSVQHVYTATGTFQVTATATDSSGASNSASTVVVLAAAAPTAAFTVSPSTGTTNTTFTFNASDSTGSGLTYDWDLGAGPGSARTGVVTTFKYGSPGTYTVRLTVTDSNGRTATKTSTLLVSSP